MINNNPKRQKKSIQIAKRIDIFLIILIFIMIISPIIINLALKADSKIKQTNLFLSSRCEELFGKEITELLLQEFNDQNPDIYIRLLDASVNEEAAVKSAEEKKSLFFWRNKIAPPPSSPDIFVFDDDDFNALAAANMLLPDSAVPLVSFMDMLFYNIKILTDAGFDHPPKTRDEFLTSVRAVSRGNFPGISAFSLNPALPGDFFPWIWAAGGNFWSEGKTPTFNTRAMTNDIIFFGSLNRELSSVFSAEQSIEEFAQGRIAMMVASTRIIPYLLERMGSSAFGITTIPDPVTGGKYNICISSIYTGIYSGSPHPEEAWRFLEFLAEKNAVLCAELNAVPGSITNFIPGDYVKNNPFYSKAWDIFEASQIVQGFSGDGGHYEAIIMEEINNFLTNRRTAPQTVAAIQRRWVEER